MKVRIVAYLQLIMMVFMMYVPSVSVAVSLTETSLMLSKSTASIGESVTASGTAEPGAWVPIKVIDGDQNIVVFDTTKAGASGNYRIEFLVPEGVTGTLTVVAGSGSNVATKTLTVTATDTAAPTWAGAILTASGVTQTGLTLTWTEAADNNGVTGYKIYKNGTFLAGVNGTIRSYNVTGLTANTTYTFKVEAGDAAGNWSTDGPGTTVTTLEAPEVVAAAAVEKAERTKVQADVDSARVLVNKLPPGIEKNNLTIRLNIVQAEINAAATSEPVLMSADTDLTGKIVTVKFSTKMGNPSGKHDQFTVKVNGNPNVVIAAALNADNTKIDLTLADPVHSGDSIIVGYTKGSVAAANGTVLADFTDQIVTNHVPAPINTPSVTVADGLNPSIGVTADTLGLGQPLAITVPRTVTNAAVVVSNDLLGTPSSGTVTTGALPEMTISTSTALSDVPVQIAIPAGVTISAPADWDGTIHVPQVQPINTVTVIPDTGTTATVSTVIEVGFGDVPLTFSKAVRLLVPGQAGKEAGYYCNGTFTKITRVCARDDQEWADANLPDGKEGKIDVGNDLVIWTKHFTRFVTYTQTTTGGDKGGGGGGRSAVPVNSSTGSALVDPAAGGTVGLGSEAAVAIPAGALQGSSKVEIKVQKVSAPSPTPTGMILASNVFEFTVGGNPTYSFAKNVTLTFAFTPAAIGADEIPAVFCYDETAGKWVNIGGTVAGSIITVQVDHFTKYAVFAIKKEENKTVILNDISGHWAADSINELVALGAINGYPDGSFKPNNSITRAEFATVLVKAFKLPLQKGKVFKDTAGHWAVDYIGTAAAHGIIKGYDVNTFGPDDPVTREQMALMVIKAGKLSRPAGEIQFADSDSISVWAREAVAVAVEEGIMKGYPHNIFKPKGHATRAEAVTVIVNTLNTLNK